MKKSLLETFLRLHRTHVAPYSIVSLDPPVFYLQLHLDALEEFLRNYQLLFTSLRGRRSYFLLRYSSALTSYIFESVTRLEAECKLQFPEVQLIHLCNEPGQEDWFGARGAMAVLCNSNCFVDQAIFKPLPAVEKRFDAVYAARFDRSKRHFLAREVASLALIYYPVPGDEADYIRDVRAHLSHAHYFNHPDSGPYRLLAPRQVNQCLNACRVGLCLSAVEGAMTASTEYLLSGLPIVTTPSQGGRDVFFDDAFVITVPPEPAAVRDAVIELAAREPSPGEVRRATLNKIRTHRQTFISLIQDIYRQNGVRRTFADEWDRVFFHRMLRNQNHLETIARIQEADAERRG